MYSTYSFFTSTVHKRCTAYISLWVVVGLLFNVLGRYGMHSNRTVGWAGPGWTYLFYCACCVSPPRKLAWGYFSWDQHNSFATSNCYESLVVTSQSVPMVTFLTPLTSNSKSLEG